MYDGATICAFFVVFASLYLTSEYWLRVLQKWVPSRTLQYALGFAIAHALFFLILLWDGAILSHDAIAWQGILLMSVDLPAIFVCALIGHFGNLPFSPVLWALAVLIAGGIQWFLAGAVYGATSGWLMRAKHGARTQERPIT